MTTKTNQKRSFINEFYAIIFILVMGAVLCIASFVMSPGKLSDITGGFSSVILITAITLFCFFTAFSKEFIELGLPSKKAPIVAQYCMLAIGALILSAAIAHLYAVPSPGDVPLVGWHEKSAHHADIVKNTRNLFVLFMAVLLPVKFFNKFLMSPVSRQEPLF